MDESLKNLLQAESEAESIVSRGEQQRDEIIQQALKDAHDMERQFKDRLPELHQSFLDKAQAQAEQTIAEMKLRYDERNKELRDLATSHQHEALQHALELLLDAEPPGR